MPCLAPAATTSVAFILAGCARTNWLAVCLPLAGLGPRLPAPPLPLPRDLFRIAYTNAGVSLRFAAFALATTSAAGMSAGRLRMNALLFGVFLAGVFGILMFLFSWMSPGFTRQETTDVASEATR